MFSGIFVENCPDLFVRLVDLARVGKDDDLRVPRPRRVWTSSGLLKRTAGTRSQDQAAKDKGAFGFHDILNFTRVMASDARGDSIKSCKASDAFFVLHSGPIRSDSNMKKRYFEALRSGPVRVRRPGRYFSETPLDGSELRPIGVPCQVFLSAASRPRLLRPLQQSKRPPASRAVRLGADRQFPSGNEGSGLGQRRHDNRSVDGGIGGSRN
jgi:hypothetical protein